MKAFHTLLSDQRGMGLSTKIAVGFGAAVGVILLLGVIVYVVNSAA